MSHSPFEPQNQQLRQEPGGPIGFGNASAVGGAQAGQMAPGYYGGPGMQGGQMPPGTYGGQGGQGGQMAPGTYGGQGGQMAPGTYGGQGGQMAPGTYGGQGGQGGQMAHGSYGGQGGQGGQMAPGTYGGQGGQGGQMAPGTYGGPGGGAGTGGGATAGEEQVQPYLPPTEIDQPTGVDLTEAPGPAPVPSEAVDVGTGAEGSVSDCGPRIGYVALAGEDFLEVQTYVDKGGNPWRRDPVQTARRVGAAKLGFSANDRFWLRGTYIERSSGLYHALVWATHGRCVFLIELYQPVKQGRGGIWAVERVNELEQNEVRL